MGSGKPTRQPFHFKPFDFLRAYGCHILPAGLAIGAVLVMVYDLAWGPWAFSDSAAYISAARNLVAGHGLSVSTPAGGYEALTLHQPFYSLLMSFFLLFDIHPFTTSKVISIVSFSLTLGILSAGACYLSRSRWMALTLGLLLIGSPPWIVSMDGAMSEPLFLFLSVASFFSLLIFLNHGNLTFLLASALLTGLALLTRYIGLVNLAVALALLIIFCATWQRKLRWSVIYTALALAPYAGWLLISQQASAASRSFTLPAYLGQALTSFWNAFLSSLSEWLPVPPDAMVSQPVLILLIFILLILFWGAAIGWLWRLMRSAHLRADPVQQLIAGALLFCLFYVLLTLAAFLFASIPPDINSRTLIPLLPFGLLAAAGMVLSTSQTRRYSVPLAVVWLLASLWTISVWYPISHELLYDRHHNGSGYTSRYYQESTVLKAARDLPVDIPWVANEPAFFLLYLNKFPYDLAAEYERIASPPTAPFGFGSSRLDQLFKEQPAALLVLQPQLSNDLRKLSGDEAPSRIERFTSELLLVNDSFDGQIFFSKPAE